MIKSLTCTALLLVSSIYVSAQQQLEYKLLATNRTTTMEKELNEAAGEGYRFKEVVSG